MTIPVRQGRFNTGVVSPGLEARLDVEKRRGAVREARNTLLTYEGEAQKRAGMEWKGHYHLGRRLNRVVHTFRDAPLIHTWRGTYGEGELAMVMFQRSRNYGQGGTSRARVGFRDSEGDWITTPYFQPDPALEGLPLWENPEGGGAVIRGLKVDAEEEHSPDGLFILKGVEKPEGWESHGQHRFELEGGRFVVRPEGFASDVIDSYEGLQFLSPGILRHETSEEPLVDLTVLTDHQVDVLASRGAIASTWTTTPQAERLVPAGEFDAASAGTGATLYALMRDGVFDRFPIVPEGDDGPEGATSYSSWSQWAALHGDAAVAFLDNGGYDTMVEYSTGGESYSYMPVHPLSLVLKSRYGPDLFPGNSVWVEPLLEYDSVIRTAGGEMTGEYGMSLRNHVWERQNIAPSFSVERVVELDTPYEWEDVWPTHERPGLQVEQSRDVAIFTHPKYPVWRLERVAEKEWKWVEQEFGPRVPPPRNLRLTPPTRSKPSLDIRSNSEGFSPYHAEQVDVAVTAHHRNEGDSFPAHAYNDARIEENPFLLISPASPLNSGTWARRYLLQVSGFDRFDSVGGLFVRVDAANAARARVGDKVKIAGVQGSVGLEGRVFTVKAVYGEQPVSSDSRIEIDTATGEGLDLPPSTKYRGPWVVVTPEPEPAAYSQARQEQADGEVKDQRAYREGEEKALPPAATGYSVPPVLWERR